MMLSHLLLRPSSFSGKCTKSPFSLTPRTLSTHSAPTSSPLLTTPTQLATLLSSSSSNSNPIAILDASWHMPNLSPPRSAAQEFNDKDRGRIGKAKWWDVDSVAEKSAVKDIEWEEGGLKLAHMMPSGEAFAKECTRLGITPSTHVVIYDSLSVFSSPRTLYTFKAFSHHNASILDGGLPRWIAEGFPLEKGAPKEMTPSSEPYPTPKLNPSFVKSYQDMVSNSLLDPKSGSGGSIVLDARSKERFLGAAPEARPGLSSGSIPNSFSLPFTDLLTSPSETNPSYRTLKSPEEIRDVVKRTLGSQGLSLDDSNISKALTHQNFITTCGSGMTAAIIWLALQVAGIGKEVGLYDESWTGYASRKRSKIVKA